VGNTKNVFLTFLLSDYYIERCCLGQFLQCTALHGMLLAWAGMSACPSDYLSSLFADLRLGAASEC
jgi:hypothetical protein